MLLLICRSGGTGRRTGLKILQWQHCTGSIPVFGTKGFGVSLEAYFFEETPKKTPDLPLTFNTLFSLFAASLSMSSRTC